MANIGKQSVQIPKAYNLDPEGRRATWDKVYLGYVKDNKDAQYMGRLKVYIPELCGEENNERSWIVVDYASPFAGATSIRNVTPNASSSQTSYGMWFVPPDNDNQVLVMFINGDPNRGVWIACLFQVDRHRMTPSYPGNSRTVGEINPLQGSTGGTIDTAGFTESGEPAAAEEPRAVGTSEPAPVSPGGAPVPDVSESQVNARTANIPIIGPSSYGSHNSYSVNGIATPGGNRLVMSDQSDDTQIRLQTRNNMQLLLHNDRDLAVLMTGDGKSRIELHGNGNIDIYSGANLSLAAEGDINLHSNSGNVNINAGNQTNMRSTGDTKITSVGRMHLYSKSNLMQTSEGDTHRAANGSMFDTSAQKIHRQSNFGIYDSVNGGDINQWAWGSIYLRATEEFNSRSTFATRIQSLNGSTNIKSGTAVNIESTENTNVLSGSNLNLQSNQNTNVKSDADLNLDAAQEGNLRAQGGTLNLQSQDGNVNIAGGPTVVIGPVTTINAGSVPSAGAADAAGSAESAASAVESLIATAATQVAVTQHIISYTGDRLGGGASQRVVTSVSSRVPSAEPAPNRFIESPGYSGTNTIERSESFAADYRVGQIEANQNVPLQCMGFVGAGAVVGDRTRRNNQGLSVLIAEAVSAIQSNYPGARVTSTVRSNDSGSQHSMGNAVDMVLDNLSESQRARLIQDIAAGVSSGSGPYRYIRGIGTYDSTGRLLHLDVRSRNQSGTVNGLDIWGPNYSISSIAATPTWFRQAFRITGTTIGLTPGQPSNPTPVAQGEPVPTNADPSRWVGTGYAQDRSPSYVQEPVPDWTFKTADQYSLSETALTDIKNFETLKGPRPSDTSGKSFRNVCDTATMIGYGHVLAEEETTVNIDGRSVNIENGITEEQAVALLKEDLKKIESIVKSSITNPITQQQYDALVDFAWNVGEDKFKSSAVVTLINDKKYDGVPTEMMRWVLACGAIREELISRRRANALRFAGIMRAETPAVVSAQSASQPPSPTVQGNRAQQAFDFFVAQGWSREQSAGLVGNLIQESNLNPAALNPRENAQGIAQWTPTGGRQARVASFLGRSILQSSFEDQLRAIQWELTNGERSAGLRLRQAVSVDQATAVVDRFYERSAGTELSQRVSHARALLARQNVS